jgi:hypothetical protein
MSNQMSNGVISSMAGLNLSSTPPPQANNPPQAPIDVAKDIYPLVLQLNNPELVS